MGFVSQSRCSREARQVTAGAAAVICLVLLSIGSPQGATPAFFDDDPIHVEPETQDASKVQAWDIDFLLDLSTNLFGHPGDTTPNVRAQNINTVGELPDSGWFTNRIGSRLLTADDLVRGPIT